MRYVLLLLIISVVFIGCDDDDSSSISCLPSSLQDDVIAFYPFTNGSLEDFSLLGHDLDSLVNAVPALDREGNPNCCYEFNNKGIRHEYLLSKKPQFLDGLNDFTISLWYQPLDSTISGSSLEVLVGRGTGQRCPDRRGEWSAGLYDGRTPVFGHNHAAWSTKRAETNAWAHLTYIKSADSLQVFFEGTLTGLAIGQAGCSNLHLAQDTGALYIGNHYTGRIDDVIIFNRAISRQEINILKDLGSCCR